MIYFKYIIVVLIGLPLALTALILETIADKCGAAASSIAKWADSYISW